MHPSVMYVLYSGRIRDWRCHWPPGVPSPYIGCFTLSSPATTAEGLCLYNSGYLHWVRKLMSHTHTWSNHVIHLRTSYLHTLPLLSWGRVAATLTLPYSSLSLLFKLRDGCSEASVQHIDHYVLQKHYCAVYYWNAGRFYFQRCFTGIRGSQRF